VGYVSEYPRLVFGKEVEEIIKKAAAEKWIDNINKRLREMALRAEDCDLAGALQVAGEAYVFFKDLRRWLWSKAAEWERIEFEEYYKAVNELEKAYKSAIEDVARRFGKCVFRKP